MNETEHSKRNETQMQNIESSASITTTGDDMTIHSIAIIGQIEGHNILPAQNKATKYEHVIPQLVAIEESNDIDGLIVILNTVGGDIEAGLAIAELIAGMSKPTVSLVLGGSHSIGIPLAVAAKTSFAVPSAAMTVHPVRMSGTVIAAPQTYNYFEDMQNRIVKYICEHSRIHEERLRELLMRADELANDVGSVLDGKEAVKYGLIDEVGGLDRALGVLRDMIGKAESRN